MRSHRRSRSHGIRENIKIYINTIAMMTSIIQLTTLYLLLFTSISDVSSFTPMSVVNRQLQRSALFSTSSSTTETTNSNAASLPIIVNGHNIALTPALVDYVNKRIGNTLSKLASNGAVRECDVVLSVNKNPKVKNSHRVEIVTNLKGTTIICKNESPDMYASIDAGAHALQRKLVKYKERRTDGWHGGDSGKSNDDFITALEETIESGLDIPNIVEVNEDEDVDVNSGFIDPEKPKVVKVNSFKLDKGISIDEAIFALDYVDHDFYVFRNEKTDQINVVYKRHHGGIGLVEP